MRDSQVYSSQIEILSNIITKNNLKKLLFELIGIIGVMGGRIERVQIIFRDGAQVEITSGSDAVQKVLTSDNADKGVKREKKKEGVPAGTIDSLRPLMQVVFSDHGLNQDFAYWQELAENAPYDSNEACILLNEANKGPVEVAKAVIEVEPQTKRMTDFGDISAITKGHITAKLAWEILGHYPEDTQEKWQKQIEEYEQILQEK